MYQNIFTNVWIKRKISIDEKYFSRKSILFGPLVKITVAEIMNIHRLKTKDIEDAKLKSCFLTADGIVLHINEDWLEIWFRWNDVFIHFSRFQFRFRRHMKTFTVSAYVVAGVGFTLFYMMANNIIPFNKGIYLLIHCCCRLLLLWDWAKFNEDSQVTVQKLTNMDFLPHSWKKIRFYSCILKQSMFNNSGENFPSFIYTNESLSKS